MRENESQKPKSPDFSSAVIALWTVRGDLLSAVLFLPVAFAFQKLADKLIKIDAICPGSIRALILQMTEVLYILLMFILEILALSVFWLQIKHIASRKKIVWVLALILVLLFMVTITTMGFTLKTNDDKISQDSLLAFESLFRIMFVFSMITSFGSLYLLGEDFDVQINRDNVYPLVVLCLLVILTNFVTILP